VSSILAIPTNKNNKIQNLSVARKDEKTKITAQFLQKVPFEAFSIPELEYYTFPEIAAQFGCPEHQIHYLVFEAKSLRATPPYFSTRRLFQSEPERWLAYLEVDSSVGAWEQTPIQDLPEFFYLDLIQFIDEAESNGVDTPLAHTKISKNHTLKIKSFELFEGRQFYLEYLFEGEFPDHGFLNIPVSELVITRQERNRFLESIGETPLATQAQEHVSQSVMATIGAMAKLLGYKTRYREKYILDESEIELIATAILEIAQERDLMVSSSDVLTILTDGNDALRSGSA
jgi:hypothetical protein